MQKPKVSIGICVRNCEEFIAEAIDSILDQDFPHYLMELILVDDGSEDATLSIIQEYASKMDFPSTVFHTSWKGVGHARNVVVASAKGDYILWVDGDMVLSKDYVRKLVDFIEQDPNVGVAKGRQALESGGNLLATLEAYSRAAGRMVDYTSDKTCSKVLGTGGAIYRVKAIRQAGCFDENLKGYGEDSDIEIRIKKTGWRLLTHDVRFHDYERHGLSWKSLWRRYWLRGYYTHYFLHKNKGLLKHYRMFPPAAFVSGLLHARILFGLTRMKENFLLPFQYVFKMSAWYVGFITSHEDSYEPKL